MNPPTGDPFKDWEGPWWKRYRCGLRICPKCERKRVDKFFTAVRPKAYSALAAGAQACFATFTIPKADLRPSECVQALRRCWTAMNDKKKLAGLDNELVGWIRVGEMGNMLTPHYHALIFAQRDVRGFARLLREAWTTAVTSEYQWPTARRYLQNPVKPVESGEQLKFCMDYMSKGDPLSTYTPKQMQAYGIATKGWQNLRTSNNWSPRRSLAAEQAQPIAPPATWLWSID